MTSTLEELEQLTAECQELQRQHQTSLSTLQSMEQLVEQGDTITVHYQCEDRDFGEVLEELHVGALECIEKGESVRFGERLLKALQYMSFPSLTDLKN